MSADTRRILLFGAHGQVGRALRVALSGDGLIALDRSDAELGDAAAVRMRIREHRPDVVINAAAYVAVDRAELEPDLARTINAAAMRVIAEETRARNAMLVYYSTDYVYDGTKTEPYVESDATNPLSVYGRTKLAGEHAAVTCPRHLIFRTSWVVSPHGTNFVKTMLRLATEREELRVVADQRGAPTSAALVADVTARALDAMRDAPAGDPRWGVYHLAAAGETTWNELARYVMAQARERGFTLRATPQTIAAIGSAERQAAARRPANSRLDTTKLRSTFGLKLPEWQRGVDDVLVELSPRATHSRV
jgi:dTDP-4-dehydrorhamnose reductase